MRSVAIIGAGAGGCAAAAVLCRRGIRVTLFSRTPERLAAIRARGGLEIDDDGETGFVPLHTTTEIAEAAECDGLFVFTVANAHEDIARRLVPHVHDRHTVLLLSGSSGTLEIARIWREMGVRRMPLLGETVTLPFSGRMTGPAQVTVRLPTRMRTAAFPARDTLRLLERVEPLLDVVPAKNVLDTGLNNPNFLFHPLPMLLNFAAIERCNGMLSLMNEGYTEAVLRAMDAHDREKMELVAAAGLQPVSLDDLYTEFGRSPDLYRLPGEVLGLRDRIYFRYIDEDVPYGTVFMSSLGRLLKVPTPINDAINTVASIIRGVDFWTVGRTVERLGIAHYSRFQLAEYLETGRA